MKRIIITVALLVLSTWLIAPPATAAAKQQDSQYIDLNGVDTHYIDRGQGPTLILVHGLGADLTRWHANIDTLAQTHRVIALDLTGFGHSEKPAIEYRAQVFVDQIHSLMATLNIESATLIGNSMGGWVSLLFAEQYPDKTDGLVLVAPAFVFGLPNGVSADTLATAASPKTFEAMTAYLGRIYHDTTFSDATINAALADKQSKDDAATIASMAASLERRLDTLTNDRLQRINARTLVIHGESDGVVPVAASQHIASLLPHAELVILSEAGHWPQLEQVEVFNRRVLSWLGNGDNTAHQVKVRVAEWVSLWNPGTAPIDQQRFEAHANVFAEGDDYLAVDDFTGEILTLRGYRTYAATWEPIMAAFARKRSTRDRVALRDDVG